MTYNISMRGLHVEQFAFTMFLAAGTVAADIGKAVTLDTSAANTVKLAAAGDEVFGMLSTFEDRSDQEGVITGAIQTKGGFAFTYTGAAPTVGQGIVGDAVAGTVKTTTAAALSGQAIVTSVDATAVTVDVLIR